MPFYDRGCTACDWRVIDVYEGVHAAAPPCPTCGRPTTRIWISGMSHIISDEIPGGLWQENGFTHPRQFYSKSERRRALAERGLTEMVRHTTTHDTDKNPYTSDWSRGSVDLAAATAAVSADRGKVAATSTEADIPVQWTVKDWTP